MSDAFMIARYRREQLKTLERQVQMNPTDGPSRKRKQEVQHLRLVDCSP